MAIEVRDYQQGDWLKVMVRTGDQFATELSEGFMLDGTAGTVYDGDEVIAVGGIASLYDGVGHVWAFISDRARGHGPWMVRQVRKMIPIIMKNMNLHRVQCHVRADKPEYLKFARLIGLKPESVMEQAAPDKTDMVMFAILEK